MKIKPKNTGSAVFLVIVVFALIAAARFIGIGTTRSAVRIGYIENGGWREWSASYALLNGTLQHTLHPGSTDNPLHVDVKTEKGTISMEVKDTKGAVVFQKEDLDTNSFDIEVTGNVSVIVHAKGHKGSFGFSFESTD